MSTPVIAVFAGGTSAEREVSLGLGRRLRVGAGALLHDPALPRRARTRSRRATTRARHVVFSTLHGTFGEDGGMQRLLDAAGAPTRAATPRRAPSRWTRR